MRVKQLTIQRICSFSCILSLTYGFGSIRTESSCLAAGISSSYHRAATTTSRLGGISSSPGDSNEYGIGQGDIGQRSEANRGESDTTILPMNKSWRALLQLSSDASRPIRGSNYCQLATVDLRTNTPRCRCVVFRGFQDFPQSHPLQYSHENDLPCIMRMTTDDRSEKVRQAMDHPSRTAELVWWFPHSNEQYRIRGELIFVGGVGKYEYDQDEYLALERRKQWEIMTDSSRESFFRQEMPGSAKILTEKPTYTIPPGGRDPDGNILPPPESFLLMLLKPDHVDYLRLTDLYRQIDEFSNNEWKSTVVNY